MKSWVQYPDIPSFIKSENLTGVFNDVYDDNVDEYVKTWLSVKGLRELLQNIGDDLGYEVKVKSGDKGPILINPERNPNYEKALPRDE